MPRQCALCGKIKSRGNQRKLLRGHYNVTAKRDFKPNLQKTKVNNQSILACTNCLRTMVKKGRA